MGISLPRLLLSGLVAGFVINLGELAVNVWLLGDAWSGALAGFGVTLGLPEMAIWGLGTFVLGIVGVWIYAAARPHYGAGPLTAVRAGAAVWAVTYLYVAVGALGTVPLPVGLVLASTAWGLVEICAAVYLGAWLYQEGELAAT